MTHPGSVYETTFSAFEKFMEQKMEVIISNKEQLVITKVGGVSISFPGGLLWCTHEPKDCNEPFGCPNSYSRPATWCCGPILITC